MEKVNWRRRLGRYLRSCVNAEWEVWDRPVRFFHWVVTGMIVACLLTGWLDPAWQLDRHLIFGGILTGLWLFRLIWGLVGSEYARFSHFFYAPHQVLQDGAALWQGRLKVASLGLNPLNAWVSFVLLLVVGALLLTGVVAYGGEEHLGPLASVVSFQLGERAQRWHGWLAYAVLPLVGLHLLIVWRESKLTRQPLLRSMITGCKPLDSDHVEEQYRDSHAGWAILVGGLVIFAVDHWSKELAQLPMDGWRPLAYPQIYQEKCGSCHWTIHPSLLPEERWQNLLNQLDHHFGHTIFLSGKEAIAISSFVLIHAAEDWDTEVAHRFRKATGNASHYIIEHPLWQKLHDRVDQRLFTAPPVGSRVHCPVCHHDALSGRFAAHAIHLPKIEEKKGVLFTPPQ
ncbi:cytochrome b/b6 domain-containing protein [Candidatus Magnetaquicoccus inordinatus]|uniref:cytochrome b/b6 domain-containing protein n=1 Tax=Candidatus Magnetaquicoccus inordinatus TaxID=2496818 RepID=UPI00102BBF73|nr:cytochrome b/b6 domain-containing protein [Candidatus Magnetaquicoccus inordinatus]